MYSLHLRHAFLISASLVVIALAAPLYSFAATASLVADSATIHVGDTVAVRVLLDTEGETLNTAEGDISINASSEALTVTQLSTAGSALSYWPQTPSLSSTKSTVTFIGGTPGGFTSAKALAFTIIFTADAPGKVTLTPARMSLYANDGKATRVPASVSPLALTILPATSAPAVDTWTNIIANDNASPKNLNAQFGQDATAYDGKRFVTISAQDDESGIAYFEVQEGELPVVRSGSVYVLRDQTSKTVIVTAYDNAGNATRITATAPQSPSIIWILWMVGAILLFVLVLLGIIQAVRKFIRKPYGGARQSDL